MLENPHGALDQQRPGSAGETESCAPAREQRPPCMLTPAKRAGLDALEREFSGVLKKYRT
jgi:hypothetical protein